MNKEASPKGAVHTHLCLSTMASLLGSPPNKPIESHAAYTQRGRGYAMEASKVSTLFKVLR